MRTLTLLLLLLTLPGLLLPGGLLLRWCDCAKAAAAGQGTCCSLGAEPVQSRAPAGCTCRAAQSDRDSADDGDSDSADDGDAGDAAKPCRTARDGRCGCVKVVTPPHKPVPVPPGAGDPLVLAPAPREATPLPPRTEMQRTARGQVVTSRPPPDHARSLPLLL